MYIIKNALMCISRSKGRNILIGIIALVIAISACIGLSIRQAAESAKESALDGLSITATISYDRAGAMGNMASKDAKGGNEGGFSGFDKSQFKDMIGNTSSLTLEEYKVYAEAKSVKDFYYTLTTYVNGSDDFQPVTDETSEESTESTESTENQEKQESIPGNIPGGNMGGMSFGGFASGDFTIVGYSSDIAMTSFVSGTDSILDGGSIFEEGTEKYDCIISEELAIYNNLAVGNEIVITNPANEEETYTLTITGFYKSSDNNNFSMSMFGASQDPANKIYMSANALQLILDASESVSTTVTDTSTNRETESKMTGTLDATYTFENVEKYEAFEEEARALGLDDSYTISSSDITAYENSLAPLETLSTMAQWFLIVILIIGGIILVVLNIFNVRDRKYEVGVLTAMGMKKWKVATQFMVEILVITMVAVVIGAGVGAVSSVPVTNALLKTQVSSQSNQKSQAETSFGREGNFGNFGGGNMPGNSGGNMPTDFSNFKDIEGDNPFEKAFNGASNYISTVDSAMNLTVVFQMLGVGLFLTIVASAASVLFIMRYDPLKILANRD